MIVLAGGDIVLPDPILSNATLVIDQGRIAATGSETGGRPGTGGPRCAPGGAIVVNAQESYVVPGFVDVHVHGVEGHDTLDGAGAIAAIASRLPRYGVTAFCPTTIACGPAELETTLEQIASARGSRGR